MKRIIMAACIVSLAACGGDKDDVATEQQQDWESQKQSLVYSFPDNNQQEVPVPSPVVLRFSSPVAETAPAITLREAGGPVVPDVELEWVDGKRGLIITPDSKLKPLTDYVVHIPAIELEKGTAAARTLHFTTRALFEGPKSQVAEDIFEVMRMIPDGENYPVMDFSSFRVQFSQPLDQATVKYGDSADATVQLMGPEGLVDAHLLVSGHYMTIDPKEDLTPGAEYSLNMTTGITSTYGETLPGGSFGNPGDTLAVSLKTSPKDTTSPTTGERVSMVQDVADSGELSPLTGQPINLVPMASVLLGEDTATQAKGTLAAELAFVPNFPEATPFRVKRGSLIEGASIDVLIGGEVPAGFESGKVRMDFLSDATGYLLPNSYSNADDAPRQVRLFMDVAVSTETASANGAITQDLLHIELVGTSIVESGQMVINAVGVVEPDVLGSERATGILSFYMKAFEDQDNPPEVVIDSTPPMVQSWVPGDNVKSFKVDDPIVVTFNKAIDVSDESLEKIYIRENGVKVDSYVHTRGSSVYIQPVEPLKRSSEDPLNMGSVDQYVYDLIIEQGIKDISGNESVGSYTYSFELPVNVLKAEQYHWPYVDPGQFPQQEYLGITDVVQRSPIVLALYPGYPCLIDETSMDLSGGVAGRCKGTLDEVYSKSIAIDFSTIQRVPSKLPDDLLPLISIPSNRPIVAVFSKELDKSSVVLGGSFKVEELDENGAYVADVEGDIRVEGKKITFYAKDEWKMDSIYRYTLGSNGDRMSSMANCDGSESICDLSGLPIQTQLYSVDLVYYAPMDMDMLYQEHTAESGGGDPLVQYFKAGPKADTVLQVLGAASVDSNANMVHERNKPVDYPGGYPFLRREYNVYSVEEDGADGEPLDPNACDSSEAECLDPDGVIPPPNSAKLVGVDQFDPMAPVYVPVVNTGCAFESGAASPEPFIKSVCPEQKFTYLTSALVSEVGGYSEQDGGIVVDIWPGQILSTALPIYPVMIACLGQCVIGTDSGPQVMRMRYAKNDDACVEDPAVGATCLRNKPIRAVIKNVNGEPYISSSVDVYIDAIDLERRIRAIGESMGLIGADTLHDLVSVPVTLNLEGKVEFMDDGTMKIAMANTNEINFDFNMKLFAAAFNMAALLGDLTLQLPSYGSNIEYSSEIIK